MLNFLKIFTVAAVLYINIIDSKSEALEAKMLCDCAHDAHLQPAIYEFGIEGKYDTKKDLMCICSEDETNEVLNTRRKRTPCLTDLVNHFFGINRRPESRPASKNKQGTSAPRQPTVETATVKVPVAKAPTAPDSVTKPVTGGDEAPIE